MRRRGFALSELMVALVIAGIIGVALARLVINQARFVSVQDGMMRARTGSRAAFNLMASELRMVSDSGLRYAGQDSVTLRVPYVFGVVCGYYFGKSIIALIPTDSAMYAQANPRGLGWRDTNGNWQFVLPITITSGAPSGSCWSNTPTIQVMSTADWAAKVVLASTTAPPVNAPIYLFQSITYVFAPSATMPGRRALWRANHMLGTREELVAPFDTSARFEFLVGNPNNVQVNPPANLDSVVGVRVRLIGASEQTPAGRTGPVTFGLIATLLFRNHVD